MYDPETQDNFKLELPASAHSGDVATQASGAHALCCLWQCSPCLV